MFSEIQKFSGMLGRKCGIVDRCLSWLITDSWRERVSQLIFSTGIGSVSYETDISSFNMINYLNLPSMHEFEGLSDGYLGHS
jgi:hypothetical protein